MLEVEVCKRGYVRQRVRELEALLSQSRSPSRLELVETCSIHRNDLLVPLLLALAAILSLWPLLL